MLWPMKLLDLVSLNVFLKMILSELIIKCVIWFGRFVRILRGSMEMVDRKGPLFSMLSRLRLLYVHVMIFFQINEIAGFGGLNFFF
jgi:hypothetical protein